MEPVATEPLRKWNLFELLDIHSAGPRKGDTQESGSRTTGAERSGYGAIFRAGRFAVFGPGVNGRRYMIRKILFVWGVMLMTAAAPAGGKFVLSSPNLRDGDRVDKAQVYNGFGYTGQNLAPALRWSGAPEGTQSYAVTMFDPDAPHPGGWWHWFVIDIPASVTRLPEGAKPGQGLPEDAVEIENDFGNRDYGGPAPPPGKAHRYVFTVYALKTTKLAVPPDAKPIVVKAMLEKNALAKAMLTGHFGR